MLVRRPGAEFRLSIGAWKPSISVRHRFGAFETFVSICWAPTKILIITFLLKNPKETSEKIAAWWAKRWLMKRLERDDVFVQLESHHMTHPIKHGARVPLTPRPYATLSLFDD